MLCVKASDGLGEFPGAQSAWGQDVDDSLVGFDGDMNTIRFPFCQKRLEASFGAADPFPAFLDVLVFTLGRRVFLQLALRSGGVSQLPLGGFPEIDGRGVLIFKSSDCLLLIFDFRLPRIDFGVRWQVLGWGCDLAAIDHQSFTAMRTGLYGGWSRIRHLPQFLPGDMEA